MAFKTSPFLALLAAFYCHKMVFCNELVPEFSMKHDVSDKNLPDETCENSRMMRDVDNEELTNVDILNRTAIDYLKVIAKAIPIMRGHVESINGKLYLPPNLFFPGSENGRQNFAEEDVSSVGSRDGTELESNADNVYRFREPKPEGIWNKNGLYDYKNYKGNANENSFESSIPLPTFLQNKHETNGDDETGSHMHSDMYKKIQNSDINTSIKHEIVSVNDFENGNHNSKESGTSCDDYCLNKFFGYIPRQHMSSCQSHFVPKPLIINFNSGCSVHRKNNLKNKPGNKAGQWNAMF